MSVARIVDDLWKSLTPEDRKKIEERLGINPDTCTTTASRYGLLQQYQYCTERSQRELLPSEDDSRVMAGPQMLVLDRDSIEAASGSDERCLQRPSQPTLIRKNERSRSEARIRPSNAPSKFLQGIVKYALVTTMALSGAYLGFSAARHTDLADELRTMEESPVIKAYALGNKVESYQWLRELDFLSPVKKDIAQNRDYLETVRKGFRKASGAVNVIKTLVRDVPLFGRGSAALIEQQQEQIRLYQQKQEQYSSKLRLFTAGGAIAGLALAALGSVVVDRRRRYR